jgi:hypothetical protein
MQVQQAGNNIRDQLVIVRFGAECLHEVECMRQSDEFRKVAFQIGAAELRIARMEKLVEQLKARGIDTRSAEELHALMLDTFGFLMQARSILEESRRKKLN